jgi:hypothetical protein
MHRWMKLLVSVLLAGTLSVPAAVGAPAFAAESNVKTSAHAVTHVAAELQSVASDDWQLFNFYDSEEHCRLVGKTYLGIYWYAFKCESFIGLLWALYVKYYTVRPALQSVDTSSEPAMISKRGLIGPRLRDYDSSGRFV